MTGVLDRFAFRALGMSVIINMIVPGVIYSLATRRFETGSLWPLAVSGLPPALWLAYGLARFRAIDWLGLFAAENVAVRITALVLAHTERGALLGRSSENLLLALLFLCSLGAARPIMFYLMRQLSTGNVPSKRAEFDRAADTPKALRTFRTLTVGWAAALVFKAAGSFVLAIIVPTQRFLILSPLWDLAVDALLVGVTIAFVRRGTPPRIAMVDGSTWEPLT